MLSLHLFQPGGVNSACALNVMRATLCIFCFGVFLPLQYIHYSSTTFCCVFCKVTWCGGQRVCLLSDRSGPFLKLPVALSPGSRDTSLPDLLCWWSEQVSQCLCVTSIISSWIASDKAAVWYALVMLQKVISLSLKHHYCTVFFWRGNSRLWCTKKSLVISKWRWR